MQDQSAKTNELIKKHLLASEAELAEHYRHASPAPELASERIATCSHESDKVFEGDYRSLDVSDCSNITIRNARIGHLSVSNSRLSLIDTDISGQAEGVYADNSDITITNGDISGVIAIKAEGSRFDLAGVHLNGSQDAVKAVDSKFVFSVSRASSSHMDGALHVYKKMNNEVL
jgi:hypothetical protein